MHTMKTNLANIKNVLHAWDRPLLERKPKPVDRDEFERAHKAIKSSRYAEIKEGGKVRLMLKSALHCCVPPATSITAIIYLVACHLTTRAWFFI